MKCFIDLDGVLGNFPQAASDAHDKPNPYHAVQWRGEYDMAKIFNMSVPAFWEKLKGAEFWKNISVLNDADRIIDLCEQRFGAENCCILTTPSLDPESRTGKASWILRHLPTYERRTLMGACKEFCAHQRAVLIDDLESNVAKFRNDGGRAMLLPRPWNSAHKKSTIDELKKYLEEL